MIKKNLAAAVGLLMVPVSVFAAFDDTTLTTDAVIAVGSVNYTVTGSSASLSSITVNASNAVLTLAPGSSIKVTSSDRSDITHDASSSYVSQKTCDKNTSSITFAVPSGASISTADITISPSSNTCSSGGYDVGFGASTASTGGGTVAVSPASTTTTVVTPVPVIPSIAPSVSPAVLNAVPSKIATQVSPIFNRLITVGQAHADVKRLQQLLNSDPETQVAKSGAGSYGKETTYFGPATRSAIMKFQIKYGIAKKGQVGYGTFGPITRAKFAKVFVTANSSVPESADQKKLELIKSLLEQIAVLQAQLKMAQ